MVSDTWLTTSEPFCADFISGDGEVLLAAHKATDCGVPVIAGARGRLTGTSVAIPKYGRHAISMIKAVCGHEL